MSHSRTPLMLLMMLVVMLLAGRTLPALGQDELPTPPTEVPVDGGIQNPDQPFAPMACSTPRTQSIRGRNVTFDQCYQHSFSHNSVNYSVDVYYTETDSATNLAQCTAAEGTAPCEHKLADADDASGNNLVAVAMAVETEGAIRFFRNRNLTVLPASAGNVLEIFLAEDPRGGGTPTINSVNYDDELIDTNDNVWKRILAFHEIMHLVQFNYDAASGWMAFFGEGTARAIEDRVDVTVDGQTGYLFIPEMNGILGNDSDRSSDLSTLSYPSALWWTWLLDQYRSGTEVEPVTGWVALRDFFIELNTEAVEMDAVRDFISAEGGSFRDDFIDYTLAMYSYKLNPTDPRLTFLDSEIVNNANSLSGHTVYSTGPAYSVSAVAMNPRSSRYWEFNPASQCSFTTFSFDGRGTNYGFSVLTVDGANLIDTWTAFNDGWTRTVRTADLDRIVGVVTAVDQNGTVDVGTGCVRPKVTIKNPTTSAFEMVGRADNPRKFIVRVGVTGTDGSGVSGLIADDFSVELRKPSGGAWLNATIVNAAYVQDDYWLLVQAPNEAEGAETGEFYNLKVALGTESDTENSAVLYIERTQDVVVVLDRSGSMADANKIQAARNAADLFINELTPDDQGGFVAFDTDADLRVQLGPVNPAKRTALATAIAAETPQDWTSVGDGLRAAATEEDVRGNPLNLCSFVLLSDGYENEPLLWADVKAQVIDNGCAIHSIALGPEASESLMQEIAAAVPGGSYDYANTSGSVPSARLDGTDALAAVNAVSWQNHLSRVYDVKAAQIAGRQRLGYASDLNDKQQVYEFYVDETVPELVLSVAWQSPSVGHTIKLYKPGGGLEVPSRIVSGQGTNEVLRVVNPAKGTWALEVSGLTQQYIVNVTAESQYELRLYVGTPYRELNQGTWVPLLASFAGPKGEPITGATVTASVIDPVGRVGQVRLYDDGNHDDGLADDGLYGGVYMATAVGDAAAPEKLAEGDEPAQIGSYQVKVIGVRGEIEREALGSFAVNPCSDSNNNDLPDCWEEENRISSPSADSDGDGLSNVCEFNLGTDPNDPDTDDGGETDGSEAPNCSIIPQGPNPFDPDDDRVGTLDTVEARPESDGKRPTIHIRWGKLARGTLLSVDIYRRQVDGNGKPLSSWVRIAQSVDDREYEDSDVTNGRYYEYRLSPLGRSDAKAATIATPQDVVVPAVFASVDPYAPGGSVQINNGDLSTAGLTVVLSLSADDYGDSHDGGSTLVYGSPVNKLQMRFSNSPDFSKAKWVAYSSTYKWTLAKPTTGNVTSVYVQFRDEAGNISKSGFAMSDSILYQPDAPSIIRVTPAAAAPGATVTISGKNFRNVSAVTFNGVSSRPSKVTTTRITVVVPDDATSGYIQVVTPKGTATSPSPFTVLPPPPPVPTITQLTPTSGSVETEVTIRGTNLGGTTAVLFTRNASAQFVVDSDTQLRAWVPATAKTGPITVVTDGGKATSKQKFMVVPPPSITRFTPASAAVGARVTIIGKSLAGATRVQFNGASATIIGNTATKIIVLVPAQATTGPITVITPAGTATSRTSFTVR